ncbi:polar amino acid transport system substrate-binding protein [Rheinheimera pacifica]|uniref:Polar amino acid transport system substrate-binding protein n=1 Tax=Rheinheimera pacifica TaxID=173990 RepID=A0A1H6KZQ3_9GAMM|nr:transporter substrate-binding domain-containing protein [Rheinheimera pacifica]SEH81431.1 polar amino acid transport system substrate-binding protein [Rheinheimera pacifica]
MNVKLSAWVLSVVLCVSGCVVKAQPLRFLTEHNPPGEYLNEEGEVSGVTASLVRILQQRLNEPGDIELMPWGRALNIAKAGPNIVLFETVRTAERDPWFKWVGPLKHYQMALYGLKHRLGEISPLTVLPGNYIACNYRNSATIDEIKALGFTEGKNLILTSKSGDCLDMLLLGRADLMAVSELSAPEFSANAAAAGSQLVMLKYFSERRRYLAFSRNVSDERIARWQAALEQSYRDGTMRKLYQPVYSEQIIRRLEDFAAQPKY